MWIRFWHQGQCGSGINPIDSEYEWYDTRPSDDQLKDEAEERVPDWRRWSERGYKYGFEDADKVPDDEKRKMINTYVKMREYADKMLAILESEL